VNLSDIVTTGSVTAAAYQATKQAQDFISAVFGHPGESLGTILGTIVKQRSDNAEGVASRAYLTLLNIGEKPGVVPLPILLPALEAASLHDEPDIQERWANLLANAADPRQFNPVSASFVRVLQDLGHREVKFLDALYADAARGRPLREVSLPEDAPYSIDALREIYWNIGLSSHRIAFVNVGMMEKHGPEISHGQREFREMMDVLHRHNVIEKTSALKGHSGFDGQSPTLTQLFRLTALGSAFVQACQPPMSS
jgi:hypothetical protein